MKRMTGIATIGLLLLLSACTVDTTAEKGPDSGEAQRVLAVEDEYVQAEIDSDEAAIRRIVDDRFVFNGNDGATSGKDDLIKMVVGWNMTGQTVSERSIVVAGETAVIFGTTELRFAADGKEDTVSRQRYTSVYTKRNGQWRFLALQMARRNPTK